MKILALVEHYLPFLGGVEINSHEIHKRLVRDGFDVQVICEREKNTPKYEIMDGVKVNRACGFRVIRLRYDVGKAAPKMILSTIKNDADVVHAHAYGFFPTYASVFSNKPTVITTHSDPTAKIYPFFDLTRSLPLKLCDHVVATTEMEKRHLINRGVDAKKITVIPNGVTLPPRDPPTANYGKVILCLARLDVAHKGQDILLQAMPKVLSKVPDAKLWIVGAGDSLAKLRGLTNKLKIGRNVEFKGQVYGDTKWSYLKNCRLLCVPPRTESFGIIYLEAMAYGLPTVTSNVGGIPEVVGDSAVLVPPNDPSALADALIQVLNDEKLADSLREKSLKRVKRFDWEVLVKKYEKLYEQLA